MKIKPVLIFCTLVVAFFAVGYLLLPSYTLSILGFSTDSTGLLITQFIGVLSLGYAANLWNIRNANFEAQRPALLGVFVSMGLAFLVSLFQQLAGSFGNLGWIGVSMFGIAFLVFGYFLNRGLHTARGPIGTVR